MIGTLTECKHEPNFIQSYTAYDTTRVNLHNHAVTALHDIEQDDRKRHN